MAIQPFINLEIFNMTDQNNTFRKISSIQQLPLSSLKPSPDNVRTVNLSKTADAELLASIRSQGLLQNLVVTKTDDTHYEVVGGGRRLKVLLALADEGHINTDEPIPCIIRELDSAVTSSLTENIMRQEMSVTDQFLAFKRLRDNGQSEAEIATIFGKSIKSVKRIMRLADLHPALFKLLHSQKIDLQQATAYATTPNQELQHAVFKDSGSSTYMSAHFIKNEIKKKSVSAKSGLAIFVGVKSYRSAGGILEEDLFASEKYLIDIPILIELAEKKLSAKAKKVSDWKWCDISLDIYREAENFHKITPTKLPIPDNVTNKLKSMQEEYDKFEYEFDGKWTDKIAKEQQERETELEAFENELETKYSSYADDVKSIAGCLVGYDKDSGDLVVIEGLQKDDDIKSDDTEGTSSSEGVETPTAKKDISHALMGDLENYRLAAVASAIINNQQIAVDIIQYQTIINVMSKDYYDFDSIVGLSVHKNDYESLCPEWQGSTMEAHFSKYLSSLDTSWLAEKNPAKRFSRFIELSPESKQGLLTYCCALTLNSGSRKPRKSEAGFAVESLLSPGIHEWFRPTVDTYWNRLSRKLLLDHGKEFYGKKFVDKHEKTSKKELVAIFDQLFQTTDESSLTDKELVIRQTWLPKELR